MDVHPTKNGITVIGIDPYPYVKNPSPTMTGMVPASRHNFFTPPSIWPQAPGRANAPRPNIAPPGDVAWWIWWFDQKLGNLGISPKNGGFNHWLSFRWLSQKIINPKTDFLNSVSSLIIWNIWKSVGMIIPNIWKMFQTTNQLSFTYWVSWKTELSQRMDSWQISTEWI